MSLPSQEVILVQAIMYIFITCDVVCPCGSGRKLFFKGAIREMLSFLPEVSNADALGVLGVANYQNEESVSDNPRNHKIGEWWLENDI